MKIQWLGHSSFLLTESTGNSIVTDPYKGSFPTGISSSVVTISHKHDGYSDYKNIGGNPTIIDKVGLFDIAGLHISSAETSNGSEFGPNIVYKMRIDGVEICHLGDIGTKCTLNLLEFIGEVDILMIPVGGYDTIDAELAKDYIDVIMPDIVIPMHYGDDHSKELDSISDFLKLFEEEDIVYFEKDSFHVDRAQFDGERTQVFVLKRD